MAGGRFTPSGKYFRFCGSTGFLFHQGLFDVLKDNGFQPKKIGNKI